MPHINTAYGVLPLATWRAYEAAKAASDAAQALTDADRAHLAALQAADIEF
jgi:hypothetical protein